ncbi:MAG: hypothetical protein WCJ09_26645 [Planctomycetota bacterium]
MIHLLTVGIFSSDAYFNQRELQVLELLDKRLVDSLIERHSASREEFDFEVSDHENDYRSLTIRYLPPTSINALKVARDLCLTVTGCVAIDKSNPTSLAPKDFYREDTN